MPLSPLSADRVALLIFIHVVAIAWGVHSAVNNADVLELIFPMTLCLATVMACATDARILGRPILRIVQFIMLMTWPFSPPIYLIWSRGWRGILWAMLWTISIVCCLLGSLVVISILQQRM